MPTIVIPVGGIKGGSLQYPDTVGTEGTGISYTLTFLTTSRPYWIISGVINCTVSSYWGTNNATITVTPTNQIPALNFWAFRAQEWQLFTSPSGEPPPDTAYDGDFVARIGSGYPLFNGDATVSGPFIRSGVADPTYGLRIFNSSGNVTLDLSSIYPEIYAVGSAGSIPANTTVTITVSGVVPNGGYVVIPIASTPGFSTSLFGRVSATNQISIQNFNQSTAITASYIVIKI